MHGRSMDTMTDSGQNYDIIGGGDNGQASDNTGENLDAGRQVGSVWFWFVLFLLYLVWDYIYSKKTVMDSIKPANIRPNLHNLAVIGVGAVIFVNGFNVVLTKLAAFKIPGLSRVAGWFLPLFHL